MGTSDEAAGRRGAASMVSQKPRARAAEKRSPRQVREVGFGGDMSCDLPQTPEDLIPPAWAALAAAEPVQPHPPSPRAANAAIFVGYFEAKGDSRLHCNAVQRFLELLPGSSNATASSKRGNVSGLPQSTAMGPYG